MFEAVFALSFGHALLTSNYPTFSGDDIPEVSFTPESFEASVRMLLEGYGASRSV